MQTTKVLNIMIGVLLASIPVILSDTGSTTTDGNSGPVSSIFQVQQLINQESMIRLTLDKQLQDLRSLVFDLKSKLEQSEAKAKDVTSRLERSVEGCNNHVKSVESKISNVTENVKESSAAINSRWTTFDRVILDLQSNFSTLQRCADKPESSTVFFTARLFAHYTTRNSDDVIKYENVLINKGGAYNTSTGTFTCPVTGTYLFSYSYMVTNPKVRVHGRMVFDGDYTKPLIYSTASERNAVSTGSDTVLYPLKKGDTVQVQISERRVGVYSRNFGGFLGGTVFRNLSPVRNLYEICMK